MKKTLIWVAILALLAGGLFYFTRVDAPAEVETIESTVEVIAPAPVVAE